MVCRDESVKKHVNGYASKADLSKPKIHTSHFQTENTTAEENTLHMNHFFKGIS